MKKCVLALLCSSVLLSAANAADLRPAYKAPALTPAPLWTGFYIGGNVGYGWGKVSLNGLNGEMNPNGVNGGVQVGYNYQINNVVLGVEGDFQGADHKDNINLTAFGATGNLDVKSDWFATVRGRIGYAFGPFMPYVTGGVAFTQAKANADASAGGVTVATASTDKTSTGYAIGGGIEYAIDRSWSVKAEYLHLGFGKQTYDFTGAVLGATGTVSGDVKLDFDIARVGVNYRF
jgi:outer membrane immunogenic protein